MARGEWRFSNAGFSVAVFAAVWFLLILVLVTRGGDVSIGLGVAMITTLPILCIALVAAVLSRFKYVEMLAWPAAIGLLLVLGFTYFHLLVLGAASVK